MSAKNWHFKLDYSSVILGLIKPQDEIISAAEALVNIIKKTLFQPHVDQING